MNRTQTKIARVASLLLAVYGSGSSASPGQTSLIG
jgi:hypothetical protein